MTAKTSTLLARIGNALDPRGAGDKSMFRWVLRATTTAGLGLALMTNAYLEHAQFFVG